MQGAGARDRTDTTLSVLVLNSDRFKTRNLEKAAEISIPKSCGERWEFPWAVAEGIRLQLPSAL